MDEMIFNIEEIIVKALKDKTLIPKALYNVKIDYNKLDFSLEKLFVSDVLTRASSDDLMKCNELLKTAAHRGICKNLLTFGLPMVANDAFKDVFISNVLLWIETSTTHHYFNTLLDMENEETITIISNEIMNVLDFIIKELKSIDNSIIDVSDFFTYNSHNYVAVDDCIMYRSIQDRVISILRF